MTTEELLIKWKELKEIEANAQAERRSIEREIVASNQRVIKEQLDVDYGTGTASLTFSGLKVTLSYPKKVKWNEGVLSTLWDAIKNSGQDPQEYIDRTLSVSETRYKNMPSIYRSEFEAARTIEAGNPTFSIKETK